MRPLARLVGWLPPAGATLIAFFFGLLAAGLLARQWYAWGFLGWFLNRLFDGLDGSLAREQDAASDFGGYLDIVLDFAVYAAIPLGLALGQPAAANFVALALLLASFYVNAASWIYLAALLEKRQQGAVAQGQLTAVTMPAGIIGGGETILFYTAFIFWPGHLALLFGVMAALVLATVGQRLIWARRRL